MNKTRWMKLVQAKKDADCAVEQVNIKILNLGPKFSLLRTKDAEKPICFRTSYNSDNVIFTYLTEAEALALCTAIREYLEIP